MCECEEVMKITDVKWNGVGLPAFSVCKVNVSL